MKELVRQNRIQKQRWVHKMATKQGGAKKIEKTTKQVKKKAPRKVHTQYQVQGDSLVRKNSSCPKCGPGVFMAKHKDRVSCGACGYTEFKRE